MQLYPSIWRDSGLTHKGMCLELCQSYCAVQLLVLERSEPVGESHELWVCHFGWDGQGWMETWWGGVGLEASPEHLRYAMGAPASSSSFSCSPKQPSQLLMWLGKVVWKVSRVQWKWQNCFILPCYLAKEMSLISSGAVSLVLLWVKGNIMCALH